MKNLGLIFKLNAILLEKIGIRHNFGCQNSKANWIIKIKNLRKKWKLNCNMDYPIKIKPYFMYLYFE